MPKLTIIESHKFYFKPDDSIPNNSVPVILHITESSLSGDDLADLFKSTFAKNGWTNSWRWGMYDYHHFHSNTFEVLAVYKGDAKIQLGGETGQILTIKTGDVLILPPGTGHKCIAHSKDFKLIGAYPNGIEPDLYRSSSNNIAIILKNIEQVKMYEKDPLGNI